MPLASSGTISIGSTASGANRSINVELGRSATATSSLGETTLRGLAGVASGAISMSNFYGKANYSFITTITLGQATIFGQAFRGYGSIGNPASPSTFGSASDTSVDFYSDTPSFQFYSVNNGNTFLYINSSDSNNAGNSGWTSLDLFFGSGLVDGTFSIASGSASVTRANLAYGGTSTTGLRYWNMGDGGQTNGTYSLGSNVKVTLAFK